ncbi:MAG: hypothetical protein HW389_3553, partial [Bacteroidetes bacterium]|nr:hypothetical protein [Bacteroidota bacterium]
MQQRMLRNIFCVLLCVMYVGRSPGQQQVDSTLAVIQTLYEKGSYLSAEVESRRLLDNRSLRTSSRVAAEEYLAFCLVAQNNNTSAADHFLEILALDSAYVLDPILTSPKILAVFNQAKRQQGALKRSGEKPRLEPAGSAVNPAGVSFRTLIFPGWEQLHQGRTTKGYILLGAGVLTLGSTVYFDVKRRDARSQYLGADSPDLASSRYDLY